MTCKIHYSFVKYLNENYGILTLLYWFIDFRSMQIHVHVFEVQDSRCWHRCPSVHWELSSTEEMAHIKFPSSVLPDGVYLFSIPNIQERIAIWHWEMSVLKKDPLAKINGLAVKTASGGR